MSLLQEKMKCLVAEKKRILKMAHDFEEKRKDILKEISNEMNNIHNDENLEEIADVVLK